jgi:hypothetical protein
MIPLFRLGAEVQSFCQRHGWRFCFVGGLALQRWGEPRVTADVDLTLLTGFENEDIYLDALLRHFAPRISDARQFALVNRVLLLQSADEIGIDVSLGGLPYEKLVVERATPFTFLPDISLRTCSAEDLVVLKAFAERPRDWEDVRGVVIRQPSLDWDYIESQIRPLAEAKESPEIVHRLRELREQQR